jgi:hypothetical protein
MNDIDCQGKCDKCGQSRPELSVPVLKDKDGEKQRIQFWCTNCLRGELHKKG